jgi:3-hydroxyacyl-CoA dehydrogenase/enoyl-CoA hydratase/3-hydroxybutyryl-CoA epimerase
MIIGFPPWTAGTLRYINGYDRGLAGFVERAHELEQPYGDRFSPPASLARMAQHGETYVDS